MASTKLPKDRDTTQYCQCTECGRLFKPELLEKHEQICKKLAEISQRRKVFESTKQRVEGSGVHIEDVRADQQLKTNPNFPPRIDWREKHRRFFANLRESRVKPNNVQTTIDPDYIQCPHCKRHCEQ